MEWNSPSSIVFPESSVAHFKKYRFGVPSSRIVEIRAVTVHEEEPWLSEATILVPAGNSEVFCQYRDTGVRVEINGWTTNSQSQLGPQGSLF